MEDKQAREVLRRLINILENGDTHTIEMGGWESVVKYPTVLNIKTRSILLKELERCD